MVATRSQSTRKPATPPPPRWTDAKIVRRYGELGKAGSLTSAGKLASALGVRAGRVQEALSKSREYQMHARTVKKFARRRMVALPFHMASLDLKDLTSLAQYNKQHKWLLFCLDVGSRYLYVRPMRNKQGKSVATAMSDIFASMKKEDRRLPRSCFADQGGEFTNREVRALFKKHGVHFYTTRDPETKAASVEKCISTVTQMLYRYFTMKNTFEYLDVLPKLVQTYNNTVNSVTGFAPAAVTVHDGETIWQRTLVPYAPRAPRYKKGDHCFVTKHKRLFSKGYTARLTGEIFRITDVILTHPVTYKLADLAGDPVEGSFYEQELSVTTKPKLYEIERVLKTEKKGGVTRHLVKWKYYPEKFNSYVNDKDIRRL